jgi:uncharacterized SAM-binding protein YcdF (DUF218 family)
LNDLLLTLGIENWKPTLAALLLPPVPFILLVLVGARLMFRRRLTAWSLVLLGSAGLWLSCTIGAGTALTQWLLQPPRALTASEVGDLKKSPKTAIVVLGAGRLLLAPEYGVSSLKPMTIERLRYGAWLARETGLPLAYSGGVGHGAPAGPSEAEIAARVAEREFNRPLRWQEGSSRDTRENAIQTLALLQPQGIERIVLVTHGFHMARALRNFERASAKPGTAQIRVQPAPMGLQTGRLQAIDWLPSLEGFQQTRLALHEWVGLLTGA